MWIIARVFGAALAAALVLSGCVPTATPAGPTPKPSATPVFASEEEALAAATKAYAAYVKVSDEILADGGKNPERINQVAADVQLAADLSGFESAREQKVHSLGSTTFNMVSLQSYDAQSIHDRVGVYLCEDVSAVNVVDAAGISIVTSSRPNQVKYQVTFDSPNAQSETLLVSDKVPWGDGKC